MRLQQRLQLKYFNHLSANELKQQVKRALGRSNHGGWVVAEGALGSAWYNVVRLPRTLEIKIDLSLLV